MRKATPLIRLRDYEEARFRFLRYLIQQAAEMFSVGVVKWRIDFVEHRHRAGFAMNIAKR